MLGPFFMPRIDFGFHSTRTLRQAQGERREDCAQRLLLSSSKGQGERFFGKF